MAKQWKEIALVLRDRHFKEDEDSEIDIFDVKVRKILTCNYDCGRCGGLIISELNF